MENSFFLFTFFFQHSLFLQSLDFFFDHNKGLGNDGSITRVQRNFIIVYGETFIIVTIFTDQGILLLL